MNSIGLVTMMGILIMSGDNQNLTHVDDQLRYASYDEVKIGGILGQRINCNISGRLTHVPMDEFLGGFQNRPGKHAWIGEHLGKWLHAASISWQYSRDPNLRRMMNRAVAQLLDTQKEDGYLGTYTDDYRWKSWDVWVHKYNLIGLLAYYRATGNLRSSRGAVLIGNLLVDTFGPDKRDIIKSGTHVGMAGTSVLQPMIELYRATNDERYLKFCFYLVDSWDQEHGPKILTSLLTHGKVNRTANAKAYEMLSNLVGLCELYRESGDARFIKAAQAGWQDVVDHQLHITGGSSCRELFQADGHLPDMGDIAETCVNVTWLQLCKRLYAITGECKYADTFEQVVYNHLLSAQAEDGNDWCYFTQLTGIKPFHSEITCCHSSGPRGIALIPSLFYSRVGKGIRINLYGPSQLETTIPDIGNVKIEQQTQYPADGQVKILVDPEKAVRFKLEMRIPSWSKKYSLVTSDSDAKPIRHEVQQDKKLLVIDKTWRPGDAITLKLDVGPHWIEGQGEHAGLYAVQKGPFVLCASPRWNPDIPYAWKAGVDKKANAFDKPSSQIKVPPIEQGFLTAIPAGIMTADGMQKTRLVLGPWALVQKESFQIWMPSVDQLAKSRLSLLTFGTASSSRRGWGRGSILDGNPKTISDTNNFKSNDLDYWQVTLAEPVEIRQVVFCHGTVHNDGGWFDTSRGKPQVLIRTEKNGEWKVIGTLDDYPDTTAETKPNLVNGQPFMLTVSPVKVYGIRVTGKPSCGNKPGRNFASCADLKAFGSE